MCLFHNSDQPEAQRLRRAAAVFFAASTSLSGTSAVFATGKHHSFLFGAVLGFDLVMIVAGMVLLNRAAKMGREQN